ncbi:peptidoglycan recognition protein [Cellulomonas fimi]|uniref:peptidoglycan recognition protein family protein n=1 Tax=Cellulomonas fimi TaxID=1708 RepID=UPI00234C1E52|nr:peptidoglycan recognition protein [Cellulomonas fimi]MDC7123254.1 peptidoglycan recognition protein [Cellulomonas fimi]
MLKLARAGALATVLVLGAVPAGTLPAAAIASVVPAGAATAGGAVAAPAAPTGVTAAQDDVTVEEVPVALEGAAQDAPASGDAPTAPTTDAPTTSATDAPTAAGDASVRRVVGEVIEADDPFQTLGLTWAEGTAPADPALEVRTRSADGWSAWVPLDVTDEAPDAGTVEDRRALRDGTPSVWVGDADAVQVAVVAPAGEPAALPEDLTVSLIGSELPEAPAAALEGAGGGAPGRVGSAGGVRTAAGPGPTIVTRAQWGARAQACAPDVASRVVAAVVHHTADGDYGSVEQAMQQLRNDQRYHIESRGWCDLGYNFVVDKWGNIYEGRANSLTRPVIGVHAGGFNTATVGIALLGDYSTTGPTPAALDAVARVAAWRLAAYGVDPLGTLDYLTLGGENSKFPAGTTVRLPSIFAHRDVGTTACPGNAGYAAMDTIRTLTRQHWAGHGSSGLGVNLAKSPDDPNVYLVTDSRKFRITDVDVLASLSVLGPVGTVGRDRLDRLVTSPEIGRFLRDRSGEIDLVDGGRLYPVSDCAELAAWGRRCDELAVMALSDPLMSLFTRGPDLSNVYTTPNGAQFVVNGDRRHEIADAESLAASSLRATGPAVSLSPAVASYLPLGAPLVRSGIVVQSRADGSGVLLDRTQGLRMSAALVSATRIGATLPLRPLEAASLAQLPVPRADLEGVVRAPDGRRVALTMGGAVVLASGQVPAATGVDVDAALVSALRPAASAEPLFVRSPQDGALFVLAGSVRRPVPTMDVAYALAGGGQPVVAVVPAAALAAVPVGAPLLAPATLVKVAGAPAVYVVDGLSGLVHLPSFETARAVGLPTAFTEVAAGDVAGYEVAARPLGTVWRCSGTDLVAIDGRMAPIPAGVLPTSAPASVMDALTCARVARGAAWNGPVFVRADGSAALHVLAGGQRRPVPTMDVAYAVAAGSRVVVQVVAPSALDAVPAGSTLLAPASLVKVAGRPEVYVVDGLAGLVHLPSFDMARATGLPTAFTEVASSRTAGYAVRPTPLGMLWRCGTQDRMALDGGMVALPAGPVAANGDPATPVDPLTCAHVARGGTFTGPVLVRSVESAALYHLVDGTRRPVRSMDRAYALAAGSRFVVSTVPQSRLEALPLGPDA